MMDRSKVEEVLRRAIGLDPVTAGPGLVSRALRSRMAALGIAPADHARYLQVLDTSGAELQALVEEVVVPESWFFRDDHPFALLADRVAPRWLSDPSRPPLRALSVPCAGGEEPYSIAMTLIDRGLPPDRFRVDAVDVSRKALEVAARATYGKNAFRSADLTFRVKHFRETNGEYTVSPHVKGSVSFSQENLLSPGFVTGRPPYDVIFCRNLLIYLDAESRRLALSHLDSLLTPEGLLVVGHAEHLGHLNPRFRPAGDAKTFAFERRADPGPAGPARNTVPTKRTPPPTKKPPARPEPVARPRDRARPGPTLPVPEPVPAAVPPAAPAFEEAARLAGEGRHDEAAALCEEAIRRGGPSPTGYFLLGVIRQAAGDRERAVGCFEKAVYLDPTHSEALLSLALASERRGDRAAADGYRRRAGRSFREKPTP